MADVVTYSDLRERFINKCMLQEKWQIALTNAVYLLSVSISHKLEAPETWAEPLSKKEHRYVEVISLRDREVPTSPLNLREEITERGELPVGISITLDRDLKSYPKTRIFYAIAARFSKQTVQYCLWDLERAEPIAKSSWTSDSDATVDEIIARVKKFVDHDPHDGFDQKTPIGFIHSS